MCGITCIDSQDQRRFCGYRQPFWVASSYPTLYTEQVKLWCFEKLIKGASVFRGRVQCRSQLILAFRWRLLCPLFQVRVRLKSRILPVSFTRVGLQRVPTCVLVPVWPLKPAVGPSFMYAHACIIITFVHTILKAIKISQMWEFLSLKNSLQILNYSTIACF